ncbi:30S ribosomal protein S2 [Candidatus Shapirobacteria bacterium]|nr:30S ribosomal protein S2 [Candidatus Shapirobacteria bacterium]HQI13489.1 30S ribosomal protein S2 [Candidatus Woesebacteria bacterium]
MTTKVKTVNRRGKSLVKKALVVKAKKNKITDKSKIKEANEKIKKDIETRNEKEESRNENQKTRNKKIEIKKEDKKYNLTIEVQDLLKAGCHLGHKVSKTNPKIKDYLFQARDGIQIFDLNKSYENLEKACNFIYNSKRNGKQIALIGTKRQAREVVRRVALDAGVAYVTDRWVGGTISNWDQIKKNIKKLNELVSGLAEGGKYSGESKRDLSNLNKEKARLEKMVGGLTKLEKLFDIVFVVDSGFEKTAVKEAGEGGLKVVAMVDSDSNPEKVDFPITVNDDNVKSITVIVEEIGRAIKAAGVK